MRLKLNKDGINVVDLKQALTEAYPEIVLSSLRINAKQFMQNGLISQDTYENLLNSSVTLSEFQKLCLSEQGLLKTEEELFKECDEKRLALVKTLNEVMSVHQLSSENYADKDEIVLIKTYYFGHEEAMAYFGVESQDCEELFRPQGFISQFTALKMNKTLKDFIHVYPVSSLITLRSTPVFYDRKLKSYGIELIFGIHLDTLGSYPNEALISPVRATVAAATRYYRDNILYLGESEPLFNLNDIDSTQDAIQEVGEIKDSLTEISCEEEINDVELVDNSENFDEVAQDESHIEFSDSSMEEDVQAVTSNEPEFDDFIEIENDFDTNIDVDIDLLEIDLEDDLVQNSNFTLDNE